MSVSTCGVARPVSGRRRVSGRHRVRGLAVVVRRCANEGYRRLRGWHRRVSEAATRRWVQVAARPESGMATAEYAIATLAAVAFAGLLLVIMRSDEVRGMLMGIIREALSR